MAEDVRVIARGGVVVQEGDPAAMPRDGCSEVLQQNMSVCYNIGDKKEGNLKDLKSPQTSSLIQEHIEAH